MTRLIAYQLEEGGTILVETDRDPSSSETVRGLRPSQLAENAQTTFGTAVAKIKPAAETVIQTLRELSDQPDEVSVAFGIKLSTEAGAIIAAVSAEANFTVSLLWKRKSE